MTSIIIQIAVSLLRMFLPSLLNPENTFENAKRQTNLKKRLNKKINKSWGKAALPVVLMCVFACGCASVKTVYVPDGEPVKIRETIKGAKVWTLDSQGEPVAGRMDIPAGWFALPDSRGNSQ